MELSLLKENIIEILDSCKGERITTIDMQGKASYADCFIIVSGNSNRHVVSMADRLYSTLKQHTDFLKTEGLSEGNWVLIDTGSIVVHLFKTEVRQFYDLEKLWNVADTAIAVDSKIH